MNYSSQDIENLLAFFHAKLLWMRNQLYNHSKIRGMDLSKKTITISFMNLNKLPLFEIAELRKFFWSKGTEAERRGGEGKNTWMMAKPTNNTVRKLEDPLQVRTHVNSVILRQSSGKFYAWNASFNHCYCQNVTTRNNKVVNAKYTSTTIRDEPVTEEVVGIFFCFLWIACKE